MAATFKIGDHVSWNSEAVASLAEFYECTAKM